MKKSSKVGRRTMKETHRGTTRTNGRKRKNDQVKECTETNTPKEDMQEIKKSKTIMGGKVEQTLRRDQRMEKKRITQGRSRKDTSTARNNVTMEGTDEGDTIQIEKVNDNEVDVEDEMVEPGDDRTIGENEEYDKNADERGDIEIDKDETRNDSKEQNTINDRINEMEENLDTEERNTVTVRNEKSDEHCNRVDLFEENKKFLEECIERLKKAISSEVDRTVKREVSNYIDVIHSMNHQCNSNPSPYYHDNIVEPIKTIVTPRLYRSIFTCFILFEFQKKLSNVPCEVDNIDMEHVAPMLKVVCSLMYSKRTGGKKDGIKIDDEKLSEEHKKMQLRLNWYMLRTLQVSPKVGIATVYLRNNVTKVEKPDWLRDGYVDKKDVIDHFQNSARCNGNDDEEFAEELETKKKIGKSLIRNINNIIQESCNRMRERVRSELMLEYMFIFENTLHYQISIGERLENLLNQIPTIDISRMEKNESMEVVDRLWNKAIEVSEEQFTVIVTYDVYITDDDENNEEDEGTSTVSPERNVSMSQGTMVPRKKLLRRNMNLMYISLLLLLKMTGNTQKYDILSKHINSIKITYLLASILWHILKKKNHEYSNGETYDEYEKEIFEFIVLNSPTQASTRCAMITNKIQKISKKEFMRRHIVFEEDTEHLELEENDHGTNTEPTQTAILDDIDININAI